MEEIKLLQFKEKLQLKGYSERTIEEYLSRLKQFFEYLELRENLNSVNEIRAEHVKAYHTFIQFSRDKSLSLEGVSARLTALKTFFRIMKRENLIKRDLSESITLPTIRRNIPKHVPSQEDMGKFLKAINESTISGIRDRAIFELLYATGIRSNELRSLKLDDWDSDKNTLYVTGKGGTDRVVPVGDWVIPYLQKYLSITRPKLLRDDSRILFLSSRGLKIARAVLARTVKKYCLLSGIKEINTHSIRHACATHLLQNGADIRYVQELLGHASLGTTQIYTKVDINFLIKAHKLYHPRERE